MNLWQNDFLLNGINDNIEFYGGSSVGSNAAITPPPDAIQEFRLQSGNFTAEFGHSTGGVVNAAIKSGTNQFHGDAWEYFRNDYLDANTTSITRAKKSSIAATYSVERSAAPCGFRVLTTDGTRLFLCRLSGIAPDRARSCVQYRAHRCHGQQRIYESGRI